MRTRRVVGVSCLLVIVATVFSTAAPANAAVGDAVCTGTSNSTYSPALTNVPAPTTVSTSRNVSCVSTTVPGLTNGTSSASFPTTASCLDLLNSGPAGGQITWNTGQTSTFSGTVNPNLGVAVLVVTFTGTITSGLFVGDSIITTSTAPSTDVTLCTLGLGTVSAINALSVVAIS